MADQEQDQKNGDIPAIASKDRDQAEPEPHTHASEDEFEGRIGRLVTRFRRRRSFPWNTAINLFVAVVVTIGTVVGMLSLMSLNRSVDEMVKQTPEIIKSARAAEEAAAAARAAATAAKTQADASMIQAQVAAAGIALGEQQASAATLQALAAARANQLAEQARKENVAAEREVQRASLTATLRIVSQPTDDSFGSADLPITNDRPTEARNVRSKIFLVVPEKGTVPTVSEAHWDTEPWQELGPVFAREQGRSLGIDFAHVPQVQKARYLANEGELYVFLRLRYCDVFGQPHWFYRTLRRTRNRGPGSTIVSTVVDHEIDQRDARECQAVTK